MAKKKLKIAIFHNLPQGGAKRYLYELSKRLSKKYILEELTFNTSSKYLSLSPYVKKKFTTYFPIKKNLLLQTWDILFRLPDEHRKLAEYVNKNYDLAIVNHDLLTKSPYILRFLTIPNLYICHEPPREFYENKILHGPLLKDAIANLIRSPIKWIDRENVNHTNLIISNSKYSRGVLKNIYRKKSEIVYPGVDSSFFKPQSTSKKRKKIILAIGSLLPYKGHDFIIRSLGKIDEKLRPKLLILGNGRGEAKSSLVSLGNQLKVKIKFISHVKDHELTKLYSNAKAFVSGSHNEPFGMVALEAQACKTPVILIKEGGYKELILDKKTGYLCPRNEEIFSKKIISALNNSVELGNNGRKYVKRVWGWEKSYLKLEKIIHRITIK